MPQSRLATFRVLSTVRPDPALFSAQGGVLGGEAVGLLSPLIIEQVQAATCSNHRPATSRTPRMARIRCRAAARALQEPKEAGRHLSVKKCGTTARIFSAGK